MFWLSYVLKDQLLHFLVKVVEAITILLIDAQVLSIGDEINNTFSQLLIYRKSKMLVDIFFVFYLGSILGGSAL